MTAEDIRIILAEVAAGAAARRVGSVATTARSSWPKWCVRGWRERIRSAVRGTGEPLAERLRGVIPSKVRDEFLDREEFESEPQARALGALWKGEYNTERPHSSLGYRTPAEFWPLARGMCLSKKTRPIPRLLNKRTGDSHYHWTKKSGAGHSLVANCRIPPVRLPSEEASS